MAKIVTLKSPSDEDIYPVTDASGIRVTGDVTLQQALDGFVYADDPTSPATPAPWVTADDVDWSTMPGYMHLVAIGRNAGVAFSTNTFIGLGCSKASGQSEIIDSAYAAFSSSTEDIILQPGKYYITVSIRFGDVSGSNNNVFGGISVQNSGTTYDDDDIRIGNWGFTNQRITVEANKYFNFTNTNGTGIRFRVWAQNSGSASKALMYIFRIGD